MKKLDLNQLKQGISGITLTFGLYLWEAVVYCLVQLGHQSGCKMTIDGHLVKAIEINWTGKLDSDTKFTWNDEQELVEMGATAIAILIILHFTDYTDLKRAQKGTRGDFWLGKKGKNGILVLSALLEISGILKENANNRISKRYYEKQKQIEKSLYPNVSKNIVIVEFSTPKIKVKLL